MGPFDITAEDINRLDDHQLRKVLGFLLEAEVKKYNISPSAIRLGGDQNARDAGVDARVEWDGTVEKTNWLPKKLVIFQSKAEEMPKSKIESELAPNRVPRPFFSELASKGGAYILFSTNNCSDEMHRKRISAMRDTVASVPHSEQIHLDFYDASRIARWVNSFPGVANEVRQIIGKSLAGWRPFENWSAPNLSTSQEYIIDQEPKVLFQKLDSNRTLIVDAIDRVRSLLRTSSKTIRLIGVSGVGKTRFAQALFDDRIGKNPINPGCVVYGDLSQSPETTANQVAEQLVLAQEETVLIVDNCPGETHRALTSITQRAGSHVRLLTIDFDVGLDQPENTQVVQLHKNDRSLIEALLIERTPTLSPLDRQRVVEFSDGNARVALTISSNVEAGDSLSDLSDKQLISRLFHDERRRFDEEMQRCAEVASLVYAFHVEQENGQMAEHPILAELAEVTEGRIYRSIAQFVEIGIAQKRGTQRAILPQALAINLAIQSLDRLPPDKVLDHFNQPGRERLFRSFTRRLGYLHQSEPACRIAKHLLGTDGLLSNPASMAPENHALFENLAPTAPEEALIAMEQAVYGPHGQQFISIDNPNRYIFVRLARNLAYETEFFERATRLLLAFVKSEPRNHYQSSVRGEFLELFWIQLSWTKAPPEQRFEFLDNLLERGDEFEKQLAIEALNYSLETHHFVSSRLLKNS